VAALRNCSSHFGVLGTALLLVFHLEEFDCARVHKYTFFVYTNMSREETTD